MGFLDKFRSKRPAAAPEGARALTNFDELQAAADEDHMPAAGGVDSMSSVYEEPLDAGDRPSGLPTVQDSTIISELPASDRLSALAAPNDLHAPSQFAPEGLAGPAMAAAGMGAAGAALPLIGAQPVPAQQRILMALMAAGLLLLVLTTVLAMRSASRNGGQVVAIGQSLMQSQRLAKAVSQALVGSAPAFAEIKQSSAVLAGNTRALAAGSDDLAKGSDTVLALLLPLTPLIDSAEKRASAVLEQQKTLTQVGDALRTINRQSSELLETAETLSSLKLQQGAPAAEVSAVGQLVMLTQRIGKSANEFLTMEGVSPEAVFLLGKDLNSFREITDAVDNGSTELRVAPARDAQIKSQLARLKSQFATTQNEAGAILSNLQGLVSARDAQSAIVKDSEPLRQGLESVQAALAQEGGLRGLHLTLMLLAAVMMAAGGYGLLRLFVADQGQRAALAEAQRLAAEAQEQEAKLVNDGNQAAILRLMNELQLVAEGDLTQQATVTEDITGAIADSVNYTLEELRHLVAQVKSTASRVTDTTEQVEATSTELLAASGEQLREIRDTGESVLKMASRINEVSAQAQQSASVARQSLHAASTGLTAVQNSIGGMNAIRDQIQETSKRIKRLGESSQEIGEITELISDITEQTNVLALNAAIQAASAGEAGRGFSVVAEEVQRLAERSADATRQIAALVKTIQSDTQDAVAAMAHSTQGVVDGARLSDAAGTALGDIDRVTRQLAELIERISDQARSEAESANVVASNIQHIFAVTEQTGEGTRTTAQMVRELSRSAEELQQTVARFKIG